MTSRAWTLISFLVWVPLVIWPFHEVVLDDRRSWPYIAWLIIGGIIGLALLAAIQERRDSLGRSS